MESRKETKTWFIDRNSPNHWIYLRIKKRIVSVRTPFQHVEIFDTFEYGRMVVLDGQIQSAESDEFIYHEILVHPVMITHPRPARILVLGAGEGATLREVLKHSTVENIVMIDIDRDFVDIARKYLSTWHEGSFEDRKVHLIYDDAVAFLQKTTDSFDVIIADISDPSARGPARSVYSERFYARIRKALKPDGIFATQATSIHQMPYKNYSSWIMKKLLRVFPRVDPFYEYIPSFGNLWSYASGSLRYSPKAMSQKLIEKRMTRRGIKNLCYYTPAIHGRLFIMPPCMKRNIPAV